jgi:hypothetical protein
MYSPTCKLVSLVDSGCSGTRGFSDPNLKSPFYRSSACFSLGNSRCLMLSQYGMSLLERNSVSMCILKLTSVSPLSLGPKSLEPCHFVLCIYLVPSTVPDT